MQTPLRITFSTSYLFKAGRECTSLPSLPTEWHVTGKHVRKAYKKKLFYCVGDQTQAQVAQSGCGASIPGDTKNQTGHSPVKPALI